MPYDDKYRRFPTRSFCAIAFALVILLSPTFTGCDSLTDADSSAVSTSQNRGAPGFRWNGPDTPPLAEVAVMSQNLYLGGDLFGLLADDCTTSPTNPNPLALPICVDQLYGQIVASDFATRAESVADEIARIRPALVGLQEVSTYYVQSPGDNFPGAPNTPATDVTIDFLSLLIHALDDRGLTYTAVSISANSDVELPAFDGGGFYDVRYQDADVVLALDDQDVAIRGKTETSFATLVEIPVGGTLQTFVRGYQTVEATVDGFAFTFVNTHLEVAGGGAGLVQEAQAAELEAAIGAIDGPVVLVGDLNSAADGSDTGSYELLTGSLNDVFDRPNHQAQPTCCQAPNLRNDDSALDKRIDYVLARGFDRVRAAETVLDEPEDRVESDGQLLWPSDHAGVAALLIHNLRRARPNS